jgi:hypothetical protein
MVSSSEGKSQVVRKDLHLPVGLTDYLFVCDATILK